MLGLCPASEHQNTCTGLHAHTPLPRQVEVHKWPGTSTHLCASSHLQAFIGGFTHTPVVAAPVEPKEDDPRVAWRKKNAEVLKCGWHVRGATCAHWQAFLHHFLCVPYARSDLHHHKHEHVHSKMCVQSCIRPQATAHAHTPALVCVHTHTHTHTHTHMSKDEAEPKAKKEVARRRALANTILKMHVHAIVDNYTMCVCVQPRTRRRLRPRRRLLRKRLPT